MKKVAQTLSATSVVTSTDKTTCAKLKDYESGKDPINHLSSAPYSSFNEGESLNSGKKQKKSMDGKQHKPRFGSLKLKLRKISSSFKKRKDKKSSRHAIIAFEYGNETSDESSVETISSTDTTYSSSKRAKSLKRNRLAESLFQLSSKVENFSVISNQSNQNLPQALIVKSITPTSKDETDSFFKRQLYEPTEIIVDDNQSSRNQSSMSYKDPLHNFRLSFSSLRTKLPLPGLKISENTALPTSSNKSCEMNSSEDVKFSISYLKDPENSSVHTSRPTFFTESKSASDVDKSLEMSSDFRERLPSSQSHSSYFCIKSLKTSLNEGENAKLLKPSNEILLSNQCAASKATSVNLNRCHGPLTISSLRSSRSSTTCELNTPYQSLSFSQETLLYSPLGSSSLSSRSLTTFPRSLLEFPLLEKIKIRHRNTEHQNLTDAPNLVISPGLSGDFDALNMRSSHDSTDSESVSSSEFLPCSYCRFVTQNSSISDSVLPYERLE